MSCSQYRGVGRDPLHRPSNGRSRRGSLAQWPCFLPLYPATDCPMQTSDVPAEQETRTIPIIFAVVADPVGSGLVGSLARPGGHVTGFPNFVPSLGAKWVEMLKEISPRLKRVAILFNPETAAGEGSFYARPVQA